jgi:uncharacterized protein (DUF1697 family)
MASGTYVALLRGINVAGKNKLPMRELVALFEGAQCREVRTYIQSGNVVFQAPARVVERLSATIAKSIERELGLRVPVILRSASEIASVIDNNPFLARDADPATLHLMFLGEVPAAKQVGALDPNRSPPDEFIVIGRDVYLRCPHGLGKSKLTNAYFDAKLETTSTIRNWRTVLTLREMTSA